MTAQHPLIYSELGRQREADLLRSARPQRKQPASSSDELRRARLHRAAVVSGPLSLARALLCDALRALGVRAPATLAGRGNADPVASNASEAGRAENRSVQVTLSHQARRLP